MTASNHFIAGALIAGIVKQPILALPLAFASHFVLDALPHFGYSGHKGVGDGLKHRMTLLIVIFDVITWVALLYVLRNESGWIYAAGFAAISPDLAWVYRFIIKEKRGKLPPPPTNLFNSFHQRIQWCERPWGIVIELGWFVLLFSALIRLVL